MKEFLSGKLIASMILMIHLETTFIYGYSHFWPSSYDDYWSSSNYQKNYNNPNHYEINDEIKFNHFKYSCDCIKLSECDLYSIRGFMPNYFLDYQLAQISCGFIDDEIAVCCNENSLQKPTKKSRRRKKIPKNQNKNRKVELSLPSSMQEYCPSPISEEFDLSEDHKFHQDIDSFTTTTNEPRTTVDVNLEGTTTDQPFTTTFSSFTPTQTSTATSQIPTGIERRIINSESCGKSLATRISGGQDAGVGSFPWMARIAYLNTTSRRLSFRCGGSLISDRYIITAAHCVTNLIRALEVSYVRLGDVDSSVENECNENGLCVQEEDFEIERIIIHPNYNRPLYSNDIALIRLRGSVASSSSFRPICLPTGDFNENGLTNGSFGIIAGFGVTNASAPIDQSPILQWIRLPFVDNNWCASFYLNYTINTPSLVNISSSQICVQGREDGDSCSGDSGGPLMNDAENGDRYVLFGLVSFGPRRCGIANFPSVYTRVASFMEWIMRNIEP